MVVVIAKLEDVMIEPQSPQREELGAVGWVNKTLDFATGDHSLLPVSYQQSTLVSFNHDHNRSLTLTKWLLL